MKSGLPTIPFLTHRDRNFSKMLKVHLVFKAFANSAKSKVSLYDRNPYVSELIQRQANGVCQLCNQKAPFYNQEGIPFLETHHIIWLSKGGGKILNIILLHFVPIVIEKCIS